MFRQESNQEPGDHRATRLHVLGRLLARVGRYLTHSPLGMFARHRLRGQLEARAVRVELKGRSGSLPRIAFLSDLHAGFFNTSGDLESIARKAAESNPDLVILGGDLIDSHGEEIFLLGAALKRLNPPLGIFAVRGNHEYFHPEKLELWTRFLEHNGVEVLVNRGVRVQHRDTSLWIAGIDDLREGRPDFEAALEGRRPGELTLFISHHPDAFPEAVRHKVDLQLSGHTHGGQIRFGPWIPMTHTSHGYLDGLYECEGCQLYVGRGGGTTLLPIRIGVRPEVGLIELCGVQESESVTPDRSMESPGSRARHVRAPLPTGGDAADRDHSPTKKSHRS